ncbi:MAG: RNA polymerase sigma factor [Rudaea sp.]|uniref:RNA polymerase sigma factor n=1 Tax=Rudaea sp. TaxID=2136325 RepID=UPI0039E435EA
MANSSTTESAEALFDATSSDGDGRASPCSAQMEGFIRAERPALLSWLRSRTALEQDAEEAAQDCFMRLLRYQHSKPAFAWRFLLYRIAPSVLADRARRTKSHHAADHVQLDGLDIVSAEPSQERIIAGREELALLRTAILDLPPKCKQVFLLNRLHGMTYAQIAKHCGISVKMVEKHIHKAVTLCLAKVEKGG